MASKSRAKKTPTQKAAGQTPAEAQPTTGTTTKASRVRPSRAKKASAKKPATKATRNTGGQRGTLQLNVGNLNVPGEPITEIEGASVMAHLYEMRRGQQQQRT